jgi:hypothetical protein
MATSRAASVFDDFIARAWNDHATRSDAVARRLRTRTPPPQTPAQIAQLVRFVVHLVGEHLGRFDDARWRLDALRTHPLADAQVQAALQVASVTLDIGEGRSDVARGLDAAQAVRAEAAAAALCLGRGQVPRAEHLLSRARGRVAALLAPTPQDHRPLAVACNNMAWTLHEIGAQRSVEQTEAMLRLAKASREHWSRAGGWLEIERAEYALALTHLSAGLHDDAWRHAGQCLAVCLHHAAPPYELVYAHEAMALVHQARREAGELAHHAQSLQSAFERMKADDRAACQGVRDAVHALRVA